MSDNKLMTYKELSTLLNVKIESAKALRRRHNWRVVPANKGREFLVEVPLSYLAEIENKAGDMTGDSTTDISPAVTGDVTPHVTPDMMERFAMVYREIGELQARLQSAESRAGDYESLAAKANALETDNRVLSVSLEAAKKETAAEAERRQKAEADLTEYKGRSFFQRLFG